MKPIYLQLHYTLTKQAIAAHIKKFNTEVEKEFLDNPEKFREKHCLTPKNSYKCVTIKASIEATAHGILDMYAKFLQRNENSGCTEPIFKINNQAVSTKRNGLLVKKTAHLHIKRLTQAGIFDKNRYVFHGTNSSFEIGFNPNVLVAKPNPLFTEMIVNNYINSVDKAVINPDKLTLLSTITPLFSDSNNGYIGTNCNHIVLVQLQEHNINMDDTIRVENNLLTQNVSLTNQEVLTGTKREHGSINIPFDLTAVALNFVRNQEQKREQTLRPREIKKAPQNEDMEQIHFQVSSALRLILSVLYKDRFVSEDQKRLASKDLTAYFCRKKTDKRSNQLWDDLWLAVMEAHKSNRRTGFIPAPIHKYLDVYFKGGLLSTTMEHVEKNVKPYLSKNKEITESINAANQWYQLFVKSGNNMEVYRKATQNLNKKQNKNYLDFFNDSVLEHKNLNKQSIYTSVINQ